MDVPDKLMYKITDYLVMLQGGFICYNRDIELKKFSKYKKLDEVFNLGKSTTHIDKLILKIHLKSNEGINIHSFT